MNKMKYTYKIGLVAFFYSFFSAQVVLGDDTEVFFAAENVVNKTQPNILFIFDTSGSMNSNQSYTDVDDFGNPVTVSQSRIGILQDVMSEIMAKQTGVNMGLSRFSVPGGPILFPVSNPDEPADPIVLRSLMSASDDATQSGNSVSLNTNYLDPAISAGTGIIGLRFQNVAIPQGALITQAVVQMSTDIDSLDPDAKYIIHAELVPNASAFSATSKNLSNRISAGDVTVVWDAEAWDAEPIADPDLDPPTTFSSPDIATVLQQVINIKGADLSDPAGWCGGNDLVILLEKVGTNGRPIIAYDKNPDFSAKLRVDFDANIPVTENGCFTNTIVKQINQNSDDSEKDTYNSITSSSTDLDFYKDGNRIKIESVALTFRSLGIPKDSKVSKARLNFVARDTSSGAAATTIYAINSANPATGTNVHGAGGLTAGVNWPVESWSFGVPYSSVDISSIVEPIFSLAGWDETKHMSFLLKGSAGTRAAYSYDGSRSRAPELEISYIGKFQPSSATKRAAMIATIEDFKANGNTPISDTFAEGGLYYKGEAVTYGLVRGSPPGRDNRISHIDAVESGLIKTPAGCTDANPSATACKDERFLGSPNYITPIKDGCQANNIILLTDGAPTSHDRYTNSLYENWTREASTSGTAGACATNDRGKDCTIKMAGLFNSKDVLPGTSAEEKITTYTIGFYNDDPFLQDVADAGGGQYFTAFSKDELFKAITKVVNSILDVNTTFVSAGVTVNQYNRLTHNDELYYSLFSPSAETVWPGNIKRYKLLNGNIVDSNNPPNPAVNLSGEFAQDAKSWWSSTVDGNEVELGGVAEHLTNARTVYSNLTGNSNVDITSAANRVVSTNSSITEAMVSAVDSADRDKILKWVVGHDVDDPNDPTVARKKMGDPLHSQPTVLIYRNGSTFTSSVYVGTNEGFLHSFNTDSGEENWSFIPKELLPRLSEVQKDTIGNHTYGLDGSVALHVEDIDTAGNYPGVVDPGEKAYLYIGMRRGGSSYYAFDISNITSPTLMFKIDPGVTGYSGLGQTWSKPIIKDMDIFPGSEKVLIFGGGYSTVQDEKATTSKIDDSGKNVYIADAITGELLWDVSKATELPAGSNAGKLFVEGVITMNAVPNVITAFDSDGDSYVDVFYASDTKAQVYRFDVNSKDKQITGGRVAHLQNTVAKEDNRRFYNSPDIAIIKIPSGTFASISIGSGYRAHPLDETVVDHFYMIKDYGVLNGDFDMDADLSSLVDITDIIDDTDGNGISDAAELVNDSSKNGWYLRFRHSGEKVLSDSVTFSNIVLFTTFTPIDSSGESCTANGGKSRLYALGIVDGGSVIDLNFDGVLDEEDRSMDLLTIGIAPEPQILLEKVGDDVKPVLCVGSQCIDDIVPPLPKGVMGISWIKKESE